jgi:RimJ/RimL family protein N-acetyltransferase
MLKGKTVNLRTMRSKDLGAYLELMSDIEARGPWYPLRLDTEVSLRTRYEKDGFWSDEFGLLLIVEKDTDRILGIVVCFRPVHYYECLELGYFLFRPEDRGKGIMTEAVAVFSKYLFDLKPFHRLQIQAESGNLASRKVAEKCGFKHEGTMREAFTNRGKPADIEMYSLLRSEIPKLPIPAA